MKALKILAVVLATFAAGCKDSPQVIGRAQASAPATSVVYEFSGAQIAQNAPRGQVFEYH
jgi:hypothetical protein